MVTLMLLFIFLLGQKVGAEEEEEEAIFDFGICPESHPFAFQSGQQCCSERSNWPDTYCKGDAIYCISNSCEDHSSCCGTCCPSFKISKCLTSESIEIENLSPDYDGNYFMTKNLEANRPIFEGLGEQESKCMWWHRFYRHWWIGLCDDIGGNAGFAYIDEDLSCPSECKPEVETGYGLVCPERSITWRRERSDEVINGVTINTSIEVLETGSVADVPTDSSSTVGVNAVTQNGTRYKQSCRFVQRNGDFVCLKKKH